VNARGLRGGGTVPVISRSGITLIETLIVVGLIGVLTTLILAGVQQAREAARRMSCLNKLKQIGIAMNSYAERYSCYPPMDLVTERARSGGNAHGQVYSPLTRMLPDMEMSPLFNATNFYRGAAEPLALSMNQTVMVASVDLFLCPSDRSTSPEGYGRVNYRFSLGPTPWLGANDYGAGPLPGPFSIHYPRSRPADFTDGLSHTIGVSERIQGDWFRNGEGHGNYVLAAILRPYAIPTLGPDWAVAECAHASPDLPRESRAGESWFLSGFHLTSFNHCMTPNSRVRDCSFHPDDDDVFTRTLQSGVFTARSDHPGGVNVLFMDGHARFNSDSIDLSTWRALGTRNGNEIVSN